jgi:hypothetical protein
MKTAFLAVAVALAIGAAQNAQAQEAGGNQTCAADAQKFCNEKQGADRRACLRDNADKVSVACRESLAPARGAAAPAQVPATPNLRQGGGYSRDGSY